MPTVLLATLLIAILLPRETSAQARQDLANPYLRDSRPWTRWWWFASIITEPDIRWNLGWLKDNGFGGVEIAWVYPLNRMLRDTVNHTPRQAWLSAEWSAAVRYAKACADSMGLGCDFTFGTLWPFGDSRVSREEATRRWGDTAWRQEITASWEYPRTGYVIDHFQPKALDRYAKRMIAALPRENANIATSYFMDSWEVETRHVWTPGFDRDFRARFGYDIRPSMDSISFGAKARERYDYMSLLSDKVLRFYRDYTRLANQAGALSRVQCSGAPCDIVSAYAAVDVPEGEAMLYEPEFTRFAASAAALTSKPVVTAETFTCLYGWPRDHLGEEQTADLKLVADAMFANGTNHIFWHGKPFNPAGADSVHFYASVHVGASGALAPELPAFNAYLRTVSAHMKKGVTYSDIAVYGPVEDSWIEGDLPVEKQFIWAWGAYEMRYVYPPAALRGYHPLWINREFLGRARWTGSRLVVGDCSFSALFVDVAYLDAGALRRILQLAREGLPVILVRDPKQPGRNISPQYGRMLRALRSVRNVTASIAAQPGLRPFVEGDSIPDFWCRRDGAELYIFFANPACHRLTFPIGYGQSHDTTTDMRRVTIRAGGRQVPLTLEFRPYQSLLVHIDRNGEASFIDIGFEPKTPVIRHRPTTGRERWEVAR